MPLNDSAPSRRDDAVRLRDILRGVRGASRDARDFALFDARDALRGLGVDQAQIDGFDAHDDAALDKHIADAHAVATALGAPDDTDHSALFGEAGQETLAGGVGQDRMTATAQRAPLVGAPLVGQLIGSAPEKRMYRPLFISPEDADPNNPMDRMQVVNVANANDEEMGMVDKAIRYLDRSPTARAAINKALAHRAGINLADNAHDEFHGGPNPYIQWDPRSQVRLERWDGSPTGLYQSPAFGLGHEFEHFSRQAGSDGSDEKRTLSDFDAMAGVELGEPPRTNHPQLLYRTDDPTGRKPGVADIFNTEHY